jgi:hypothetical protein
MRHPKRRIETVRGGNAAAKIYRRTRTVDGNRYPTFEVCDYTGGRRQLKRLLTADHPWPIGYAYETPCYIPSVRLIKEGGYETESSLIYYGFYGPFRTSVEDLLVNRVTAMVASLRAR